MKTLQPSPHLLILFTLGKVNIPEDSMWASFSSQFMLSPKKSPFHAAQRALRGPRDQSRGGGRRPQGFCVFP